MTDLAALVRRHAGARMPRAELRRELQGAAPDWRGTEQSLAADLRRDPHAAQPFVRAFADLADVAGTDEARGRAARLEASWLTYVGRHAESREPFLRAVALLAGAARDGARLGLANAELRLGDFDAARKLADAVRRAAKRRGDAALVAPADLTDAIALHESGRPERALALYERSRAGFVAGGHRHMAAVAAQNLANALVLLDRYAEAAPLYAEAAQEFEALGLGHEAAGCLYNRGALLAATDRLGEADETLLAAEDAFRRFDDPMWAALARTDRGQALLTAGLFPEARHALTTAAAELGGAPPLERARNVLLRARAEVALGDGNAARKLLARPLPAALPVRAEREEIRGRAAALDGRLVDGRKLLESAARAYGRLRPAGRARSLAAAAWCAAESDDPHAARRLAERAERAAAPLAVPSLTFAAAAVSFVAEDAAGRRPQATAALARALRALEDVRSGLGPDAMRAAVLRGREAWFARAVRHVLAGPGGEERALELVERWRARALVDLLGAAGERSEDERVAALRAEVAALEKRVEGTLPAGFLRTGREGAPDAGAEDLVARLREAEREFAAAAARFGSRARAEPVDLAALRRRVPRGTLLLSFFADDREGLAFALDRDGVRAVRGLGSRDAVAGLVEELHFRLGKFQFGAEYATRHAGRLRTQVDEVLHRIAAVTLAPLASELERAERLVVVPHGSWHHVPFAALPHAGGRLVERLSLTLTPALAALAPHVREAAGRPVVLGLADAAAPTIGEEAARVAQSLGDAALFVGEEARADRLVGRRAPRCVHVASHGRYRPDAPGMSGVRLSDGWFRAVDFASLSLEGSLVVLSGCETGVSRVDAGDEVQGLVRGVLASGAAELLASLWRVDDEATARFMVRFHGRRREGDSSEAALAAVQREFAAEGLHPWYWAGFALWSRRVEKRRIKMAGRGPSLRAADVGAARRKAKR